MLRLGPAILNGSGVKDSTIPSFVIATGGRCGQKPLPVSDNREPDEVARCGVDIYQRSFYYYLN